MTQLIESEDMDIKTGLCNCIPYAHEGRGYQKCTKRHNIRKTQTEVQEVRNTKSAMKNMVDEINS